MKRNLIRLAAGPGLAALAASVIVTATAGAAAAGPHAPATTTPIKHVVVIIGENHSFDNVFATYRPPKGQHIRNLLSEGIINANGGLGPNWRKAQQYTASDRKTFSLTPRITGVYKALPRPNTTYVPPACDGQQFDKADKRFPANLPDAPYQITKYVPYFDDHLEYSKFGACEFFGAYMGDPIHRFYQNAQQTFGYDHRLFTWTANTAIDDNGAKPPTPADQGSVQMGYYNMAEGDEPILRDLAQNYAISDNYHQAVLGGTGANHIALGTGYAGWYQNAKGQPARPPKEEIENPNPMRGTNNAYIQDGYFGGSYSECSNPAQPGVGPILKALARLPYRPMRNCRPGHYYLLNNYNAGYNVNGTVNHEPFTLPPQHHLNTIGNELSDHHISWGWYGEGYNHGHPDPSFCGICDPMQYVSSIMTNPKLRANTQHDANNFIDAAIHGRLPAVSFLKPGDDDGHPGYSTMAAFENFTERAISAVQDNPKLWRSTAIFITFDESGGYYDSGYIQHLSFFGDGPRVPLIVVSPYARRDFIDHTYTDHVSILKFIEANWGLPPLSKYSEDNLPNATPGVYIPKNRPAIGNLMTLFDFSHPHFARIKLPVYRQPRAIRLPNINDPER